MFTKETTLENEKLLICKFCHRSYSEDEVYVCPTCDAESCSDCGGRCGCLQDEEEEI